jgi:hypothetical protein
LQEEENSEEANSKEANFCFFCQNSFSDSAMPSSASDPTNGQLGSYKINGFGYVNKQLKLSLSSRNDSEDVVPDLPDGNNNNEINNIYCSTILC